MSRLRHFRTLAWSSLALQAVIAFAALPGCAMIDTAAPAATQPTPLSWLTNWVSQPMEMAPGFDVETIKPPPAPTTVVPHSLLEVTVWDLYEPGKPSTYPVRVSSRKTIEAPLLGEISVEGQTISQVEAILADGYRRGEFLLNPKVLVRSLDPSQVKVHVSGGVARPGYAELNRSDRSVYAAILSAGGLTRMSGTQVGVTRQAERHAAASVAKPDNNSHSLSPSATEVTSSQPPSVLPHDPVQHANNLDEISVPQNMPAEQHPANDQALYSVDDVPTERETPGGLPQRSSYGGTPRSPRSPGQKPRTIGPGSNPDEQDDTITWYDVSLAPDREQLKTLQLAEGDTVVVKTAALPVRVGGIVNRAGSIPLPPGRTLNVWQAIDMAGGVRDAGIPLNITLLRPAGEGRGARRWVLNVTAYSEHPMASPVVEPGDVLHVEPTTGGKIKRAVGDLWNKP
jgi:protein involved in polysaccharide export with SLBB domain